METNKKEKNACTLTSCNFNTNGRCQDIELLKNPWKETGCIYFQNKNIQTEKASQGR